MQPMQIGSTGVANLLYTDFIIPGEHKAAGLACNKTTPPNLRRGMDIGYKTSPLFFSVFFLRSRFFSR